MINGLAKKIFLLSCCAVVAGIAAPSALHAQSPSEILKARLEQADNVGDRESALPAGQDRERSPGMSLPADGTGEEAGLGVFAPDEVQRAKTPEEIEKIVRERAMAAALTGLLPMNPDEIRQLLERFDDTQQAVEVPVYPYPEPEVIVDTVSLDPGTKPPVVKVGVGHVTTITLLDVTGAPWPIQDLSFAGNFEVVTPEAGGHVIRVTGMSEFAYGNISIRLLELKTPVTFTLKTSRDSVHYRFDARIPEYGPFAEAPLIDGGLTLVAGNSVLGSVLDGIPPVGSRKLDVSGVDGRTTAYEFQGSTYVRTPLTLLSPGWSGSVSSADGMNVYAVTNAPVLLLSDRGQVVRAMLSEKESLDE